MTLATGKYRYRQVAGSLRKSLGKEYRVGELLASEADLAEQFSVAPNTIRQALDLLVEEGLVRRYHGRGTVVMDPLMTGEFAIVAYPDTLLTDSSPYWRTALAGIMDAMYRWNPRLRINVRLGQRTSRPEDFPATLDMLEPGTFKRLRGVFSLAALYDLEQVFLDANIPVVSMGIHSNGCHVNFDYGCLPEIMLTYLHSQGCKKIGVLSPNFYRESDGGHAQGILPRKAAELGLEIRPEWIPQYDGIITEKIGFDMFQQIWSSTEHPEAIVAMDEMLCRGALRAMMAMSIEPPRDLKLMTQSTRGVDLPYHKPVTRVEFDASRQVNTAADMMIDLLAGRTPKPMSVLLPGELVMGQTA